MKKRSRTTNENLIKVIDYLKEKAREKQAFIWADLAERLASSRRNRARINVSRLWRHTKEKEVVAIPGKVLGAGTISHPVTVAALSFSAAAREKITKAGGKCVSFEELVEGNPSGKNVRIMR
ncbi:MAG: 50S ribosomal protein L18e [Candidatus Hydrothermarchaeales archaeon]